MGEKPLNKRCAYPADPRQSAQENIRFVHSRAYLDAFLRMLCACLCAIHKPAQHVSVSTMKTPMTVAVLACSLNCTVFSARHEDASVWMPVKVVHRLRIHDHQFKCTQFRARSSGNGHGARSETTDQNALPVCDCTEFSGLVWPLHSSKAATLLAESRAALARDKGHSTAYQQNHPPIAHSARSSASGNARVSNSGRTL